jgi:lysophospholipase L1-like esterase
MTKLSHRNNIFALFAINFTLFFVLIGALELSAYGLLKLRPLLSNLRSGINFNSLALGFMGYDNRINSPVYLDKIYAKKLFNELNETRFHYEPYNVWLNMPASGVTTNIDSFGRRKTCQSRLAENERSEKKIFIFGGSTMFGTGTDDCNTIPSLLALELAMQAPKSKFHITNYGTSGYQSTQQIIQLIRLLQSGLKPDIVLFYDGINDVYASGYSPAIPGAHQNLHAIARRFEDSAIFGFLHRSNTFELIEYVNERINRNNIIADDGVIDKNKINEIIQVYKTNVLILDKLSKAFNFRYIAFWQPVLLDGTKPPTYFESEIIKNSGVLNKIYQDSYLKLKDEKWKHLSHVDLSNIFQYVEKDIYIDAFHIGNQGNQLVAQAMAPLVLRYLAQ